MGITLLILIINNLGNIVYKEEAIKTQSKENTLDTIKEVNVIKQDISSEKNISSIEERLSMASAIKGKQYIKKCVACHSFNNDRKNLYNRIRRSI